MTVIDLSQLPAPTAIEDLSFETILAAIKADFLARWDRARADDPTLPAYDTLDLETDPVAILMQSVSYREVLLRARFNDGLRQMLIAFATSTNLDHLGGYLGVLRQSGEQDDRYRKRIQLRPEALSLAGPEGAYVYHALTAVPELADASAIRSADGEVTVTLLASADNPQPTAAQIATVRAALDQAAVMPLTDTIIVRGPDVIDVAIAVELTLYPGPDGGIIRAAAEAALVKLKAVNTLLNQDLSLSAVYSRAHQDGVQAVRVISPASSIAVEKTGFVRITSIAVTIAGRDT